MAALILTLNVVAPSTADVRVLKYVVQVIPQVRGRVIEVPVEPNRLVKKGELLFQDRPDAVPERSQRRQGEARRGRGEARASERRRGGVLGRGAGIAGATRSPPAGRSARSQPRLELARLRVRQNRELVATGAGDKFALEQAEANVIELGGPDRDRESERGAGRAEAVGAGERRAGVGRLGARAARHCEGAGRREPRRPRQCAVEPRPDGRLCADFRLRDQRAVAAGLPT